MSTKSSNMFCRQCSQTFEDKDEFYIHFSSEHRQVAISNKWKECEWCAILFPTAISVNIHQQKAHPKEMEVEVDLPVNTSVSRSKPINTPVSRAKPVNTPVSRAKPVNTPVSKPKSGNTPASGAKPVNKSISRAKQVNTPTSEAEPGKATNPRAKPVKTRKSRAKPANSPTSRAKPDNSPTSRSKPDNSPTSRGQPAAIPDEPVGESPSSDDEDLIYCQLCFETFPRISNFYKHFAEDHREILIANQWNGQELTPPEETEPTTNNKSITNLKKNGSNNQLVSSVKKEKKAVKRTATEMDGSASDVSNKIKISQKNGVQNMTNKETNDASSNESPKIINIVKRKDSSPGSANTSPRSGSANTTPRNGSANTTPRNGSANTTPRSGSVPAKCRQCPDLSFTDNDKFYVHFSIEHLDIAIKNNWKLCQHCHLLLPTTVALGIHMANKHSSAKLN